MQRAAPPAVGEFQFVTGNRPEQLKSGSNRNIRSYLSRKAWQAHFQAESHAAAASSGLPFVSHPGSYAGSHLGLQLPASVSASTSPSARDGLVRPRRRRKRPQYSVTFEYTLDSNNIGGPTTTAGSTSLVDVPLREVHPQIASVTTEGHEEAVLVQDYTTETHSPSSSSSQSQSGRLPIDFQLGGGRVDPFRSYSASWQPYIPALVDHYVIHMAGDVPELDLDGPKGQLRTTWFHFVIADAAAFSVVMLLSAANYISVDSANPPPLGANGMLQLKHNAIMAINDVFVDERTRLSDGAIGAIAKMASYEAVHGDVQSYRLHMDGLQRMIELRGGLSCLGLGGLLRRMIIWIDLNSSFLLKTSRYFPEETFAGEVSKQQPDPARFIGL